MNNLRALLLQGKDYRETFKGELNGKDFEVTIRPLTDNEKAQLQLGDIAGIDLGDVAADMSKGESKDEIMASLMKKYGATVLKKQIRSLTGGGSGSLEEDQKLCSLCIMDGEKPMFTLDEVKELFIGGITGKIADRIRQISGLNEKAVDEIEPFRE